MAMSMFLRNGVRCTALPNLMRSQNVVSRLAGNNSPLQSALKKDGILLQRVKQLYASATPSPRTAAMRNMSMLSASKHWTIERVLSVALYAFIPLAISMPGTLILDNCAIIGMLLHSHWGIETICVDYIRPVLFGPVIPKVAVFALSMITLGAMASLLYFNANDIGFGQAVVNLWTLKPKGSKKNEEEEEEMK